MAASTASGKGSISASDKARCDALSEVLADSWWAVGLRGILGILFGLICLLTPGVAVEVFVILFSAYMLVDGVFAIMAAVRAAREHERWGLLVLEGVADIVAGVIAVLWPGITVLAFVLLVAAWAVVSGSLMLVAGYRLNIEHGRWWLLLAGALSVAYGALLAVAPMIGALVLTWWFGAYALLFGVTLLVLAFRLKARNDERSHPAVAQSAA